MPFVVDLAQQPEDKQAIEFLYAGQGIGRPYIAPPGLPADRLKMVQDAFAATMKDPDFIAETDVIISRSIRPTARSSRRWSRRPMPRRNRSSTGSRN